MPRNHRAEIVCLALLAVLAVVSVGRRDLFVGDETKYGQVIREMHAEGTILVPTLNGEPYTHKPPLHFWLIFLFTTVGGQSELWPYVLPAMLCAGALIWLTGRIAEEWLGEALVWPTRFFTAGLALVWGLAQVARMDAMFAVLTTAGALGLFRYLDANRTRDGLMAGLWFGLAGLVKGPAAILILVSLFAFESVPDRRRPRLQDLTALLVSIAVPLLWFVPAIASAGSGYLEEIMVRQTAGRAVSSWVHREPPWYYVLMSPAIVFPWFFPLVSSIRAARAAEVPPAVRRCIRWILAILVPFSLISSKLPVYMVPALPPVALLVAWFVGLPAERMRWRQLALWGNRGGLALLAATPAVVLAWSVPISGDEAALIGAPAVRAALAVMAFIGVAGLVAGWGSLRIQCLVVPFVVALPLSIMLTVGAQTVNDYASSRPLVDELAREARLGEEIGMYYTPHLWSRDMPAGLQRATQLKVDDLKEGRRPDLLVVRGDKLDVLDGVLNDYAEVSAVRFMGKTFHVYRRH